MTPITAAGYVITLCNSSAIWGCGNTETNAWADFRANMDSAGIRVIDESEDFPLGGALPAVINDFRCEPATADLLRHVERDGGVISWRYVGGVACTIEEQDAA